MRTDNEKFPITPLNPVIVTKIVDGKIVQKAYNLGGKTDFESFVEDNLIPVDNRTLIGVWKGEWRSDVFQLDFDTMIQRVIEAGKARFKTFKY